MQEFQSSANCRASNLNALREVLSLPFTVAAGVTFPAGELGCGSGSMHLALHFHGRDAGCDLDPDL